MKSPFRLLAVILPVILTLIVGWWAVSNSSQTPAKQPPEFRKNEVASISNTPAVTVDSAGFRNWLDDFKKADASVKSAVLERGIALATQRRSEMARLIREDPEQALRQALRLDEYAALPAEIRVLVEHPFSAVATYNFYPVCNAPVGTPDHLANLTLPEGQFAAFTFGRREGLMSKNSLPVQGIALDGAAALDQHALRELNPAELATAQTEFPAAQKNPSLSFLSGAAIVGEPTVALGGGKLYHFANRDELASINLVLAQLDDLPGPNAGSDALYQAMPGAGENSDEAFDPIGVQGQEQAQASEWTEQPKRVFMIRVDFSDLPGASHTQEATATALNGPVSDQIRAMSYGKTWIIGGVSANTYRLPQTSAYYVNSGGPGESLNNELLRDSRNTFRATRSGGDATVNIGPQSLVNTGGAGGLGDYDIVGVLFSSMSMRSSLVYGGLAGGNDIWMQGTIGHGIFTHEFGHNYGIGHSGFWQTSDGSVTGAGANVEYGDSYDIMGSGDVPKGHFHPQAKSYLNWLGASEWNDATASGSATHRIYRIDNGSTVGTPRGVRITRSAGTQDYLWLGYRPIYTGMPYLENGAYMVWKRPNQSRSWLLDSTPATNGNISDAPIQLGHTFSDTTSAAFVTPLATGGAGAEAYLDVRVNIGPFPGNGPPIVGAINGPATVPARTSAAYALAANDPNGDTLAYAWNLGDGSILPSVTAISPSWAVGGNYNLSVTVSDMKGGTATAARAITVTDPLDTWTVGSVGTTDNLKSILYANGRYLAASYWGDTFFSWDGLSWSAVGPPPDIDQPQFASGAGVFVAAGVRESAASEGQLCWSADGRRWQKASFPAGVPNIRTVVFGNSRFVAVGDDGAVLTSQDGVNWTLTTVATAPDFRRLTWTGSTWIAMAMHPVNNRPEITWTSPDAIAWTQRAALGIDVFSIFSRTGVCYALGWYGGVKFSTDQGQTWQDAALPVGTRWTTNYMSAAPDGTLICSARAMDEVGSPGALLVSTDGLRWTRTNGNTELGNIEGLTFAGGRFFAVDDAGVTRRSNSFYPTNTAPTGSFTNVPVSAPARQPVYLAASGNDVDGDALTYVWDFGGQTNALNSSEIAPTFDFGGPYSITLRISDGRGGITNLTTVLSVTDPARTFTNRSISGTPGDFQAIASGGGRVVAVGSQIGGSFTGVRAWSTDGVTWNAGNVGANRHLYALVHDGTRFVGAGTRYDFAAPAGYRGWVATSTDGVAWTDRYFTGTWLNAITYGGGVYLAAGNEGSLVRSTDGLSWSAVAIPGVSTAVSFQGLAWNGSVFLLTGYTGNNGSVRVFTSTNGIDWMDQSAGAGLASWQDFRNVAWLNDRFISSGFYSKLRVSTNGGTTFSSTRTDSEDAPAVAYGSGLYFAAGINQSASDADTDLYSRDGVNWSSYVAPTTTDRRAAIYFNNSFITVGDLGSIWQSATLTPSTGFVAWQTTQFPNGGLAALATSDPDRDGLTNRLEYALALSPHTSDTSPTSAVRFGGRASLRVTLPEPARADIKYRVEGTSSLTTGNWTELARKSGGGPWTWQTSGISRISVGTAVSGRSLLEVGQPDDQLNQARYFLRLVIGDL